MIGKEKEGKGQNQEGNKKKRWDRQGNQRGKERKGKECST